MLAGLYDLLRRASGPRTRAWFKPQPWFVPVTRVLFGTGVYSESYFESIERIEAESVRAMARWMRERLAPARAIDAGCGPGHMMQAMAAEGVEVRGVDIADAALRRSRAKGLDVERFDLTQSTELPGRPYDLVVCCEVAEHLEATHARTLVRTLCGGGDTIFMTAAEPDPEVGPGLHHVNEQPNSYWIALMSEEGFALDEALTVDARARFSSQGVIIYLQRVMVFRRR